MHIRTQWGKPNSGTVDFERFLKCQFIINEQFLCLLKLSFMGFFLLALFIFFLFFLMLKPKLLFMPEKLGNKNLNPTGFVVQV